MLRLTLRLPGSASLKDKRQVVRSVAQRVRNTFHAAVAEVADNDAWQIATLGVACVSNERHHCEEVLRAIVAFIEDSRPDAEVVSIETDVIAM